MTPYVIEDGPRGEKLYDVFARLLKDRIVFVGTPIGDEMANVIVGQLLHLDQQSQDPIKMYINSPGGVVTAGLAILDTMQLIKAPVHTYCIGQAASMGAVLLAAGEPGYRKATSSARVMIHQPLGGAQGQLTDMQIRVKEAERLQKILYDTLAKATGKPYKKIFQDCERDNFMSAEEAKAYGLIDTVL